MSVISYTGVTLGWNTANLNNAAVQNIFGIPFWELLSELYKKISHIVLKQAVPPKQSWHCWLSCKPSSRDVSPNPVTPVATTEWPSFFLQIPHIQETMSLQHIPGPESNSKSQTLPPWTAYSMIFEPIASLGRARKWTHHVLCFEKVFRWEHKVYSLRDFQNTNHCY